MNGFEVRERRLLCIAEGLGSTTPKEGKELALSFLYTRRQDHLHLKLARG